MNSEEPDRSDRPAEVVQGDVLPAQPDYHAPERPRAMIMQLPLAKNTYITNGLIIILAVIFLLENLAGGDILNGSTDIAVLDAFGALNIPAVYSGEYWRMFTSMFLHIGLLHILFNGYALYVLGRDMERLFGHARYIIIYILSGLFGSLLTLATADPRTLSAGASGAIFGLLGGLGMFFFLQRQVLGQMASRNLYQILFFMVINLIFGFTQPFVGNAAHIGGLIGGIALAWLMSPRYEPAQIQSIPAASPVPAMGTGWNQSPPHVIRLIDVNPLRRTWWVAVVAFILIVVGTIVVGEIRGWAIAAQAFGGG